MTNELIAVLDILESTRSQLESQLEELEKTAESKGFMLGYHFDGFEVTEIQKQMEKKHKILLKNLDEVNEAIADI